MDGVRVVRVPVMLRVSKGVIAPMFGWVATKLALKHDIIHLHLPQFDAAGLAVRGRLLNKPSVITFHCDLLMPPGLKNKIINLVVHCMNNLAGLLAHRIVTYTDDYGKNTPYLRRFFKKLAVILPPVELPKVTGDDNKKFLSKIKNPDKRPIIGMAARFASEKGVEVLLKALPKLFEKFPDASVLFAGQYKEVLGEDDYILKLQPEIDKLIAEDRWQYLGVLNPAEMSSFFSSIDLLVVPSLNSTESFGLVQIEAMMHGVPVAVSNLPGVRQPVTMSGMGKVFPIGDSKELANSMLEILSNKAAYTTPPENFFNKFSHAFVAEEYEKLFNELLKN